MATYGQATYTSDDGNNYNIRLNDSHFTASSLSTGVTGQSIYPHRWRTRLVHGVSAAGKKASIPVDAGDTLFVGGSGSFSIAGTAFAVTGRSGEKRPNLAPDF